MPVFLHPILHAIAVIVMPAVSPHIDPIGEANRTLFGAVDHERPFIIEVVVIQVDGRLGSDGWLIL